MVCADYGMGQCKPPTWSKVGMEITPGELNKAFLAKDSVSSAICLGTGWSPIFFYLGLAFVIAVVFYLWISKKVKKQPIFHQDSDASKEKMPEEKTLYEKILARMGKVEERIESLEEFVQRLSKKAKARKMGDQKDSD